MASVAVIGAGMAGISAARALVRDGFMVTVFDRGTRLGGRCSSTASPVPCDHGAQYLCADDPEFARTLTALEAAGVTAHWSGSFIDFTGSTRGARDRRRRYVGVPFMCRVIEALAEGLSVVTRTQVTRAHASPGGWRLYDADNSDLGEYDALTLAMPPEQARALVPRHSTVAAAMASARSKPCWSGILAFATRLPLPYDAARFAHPIISSAVRDSSKPGRSADECWVVHADPRWSSERFRMDPELVATELTAAFFDAVAIEQVQTRALSAHRWGFARVAGGSRPGALWDDDLRLGVCGDWCVAPDLEGAWLSGREAAALAARSIGRPRRRSVCTTPDDAAEPA